MARFAEALRQCAGYFVVTVLYLPLRALVLKGLSHSVTPVALRIVALTEPSILRLYARHLLFPTGLSALYGLPYVDRVSSAAFLIPATFLLAALLPLAWGISRLQDRRLALFACCWMILPVVPVLWLRAYAEGDIAHDRYLYIPSIGFVLLLSMFLAEIAEHWATSAKALQFAGLAAIAVAYAWGNVTQQSCWATDLLLYQRAYQIAPHDNLICNDLGTALMDAGDTNAAVALYSQVLAREPRFWLSNYNLGYTYYRMGKFPEAEHYLRRAVSINAADSDEFVYLGLTIWRQGRAEEGAEYLHRAIQIRPAAPGYHFALAMIRRDENDVEAAASELNLELRYHPESIVARQQLETLASGASRTAKDPNSK
jgi:tetratricopeptide (TPR) repeat protein